MTKPSPPSAQQEQEYTLSSPSAARRQALKDADAANQLRVLDSYPLTKYMNIAQLLLERFQLAVDDRQLDEAYVYGMRFATLVLESLPLHPEWKKTTRGININTMKQKKRLANQVDKVLSVMEIIKQRMDAEEIIKIQAEKIRNEHQKIKDQIHTESERSREQEQREALEKERRQFLAQQKAQQKKKDIEQSAMAKLYSMLGTNKADNEASRNKVGEKGKGDDDRQHSFKTSAPSTASSTSYSDSKTTVQEERTESKPPTKEVPMSLKNTAHPIVPADKIGSKRRVAAASKKNTIALSASVPLQKPHQPERKNDISEDVNVHTMRNKTEANEEKKTETHHVAEHEEAGKSNSSTTIGKSSSYDHSHPQRGRTQEVKEITAATRPDKPSHHEFSAPSQQRPQEIISASHESVATTLISEKPPVKNSNDSHRPATPRTSKEQATVNSLQRNIEAQEQRLELIENKHMPFLHDAAKTYLKNKKRDQALRCVARKRRLEYQVDVIKESIFKMETQMFMLENAMEDRLVKKTLEEATSAISGLQQAIGDPNAVSVDLTDLGAALPSLDDIDESDEELMEELQEWLSPVEQKAKRETYDEDVSILSLPTVPSANPDERFSKTQKILNAVLGS